MSVKAFGVPRFAGEGKQRPAASCIDDINKRLESQKVPSENVISIQVDTEFYHVFYRTVE